MPLSNLIDHYDKRAMMDMAEELKPPQTFLMQTFVNDSEEFTSRAVDLDIRKGKRKMSAYVRRAQQGQFVEKIGFSTRTFEPPYLKPKIAITPSDLQKRMPQEGLYDNTGTLAPQVEEFIARQINDLDLDQIVRNEEWQVRQALFDGKIEFRDENKALISEIDFDRDPTLVIDVATKWDDAASNPLEDGAAARRAVNKASGFSPRFALMAPDVVPFFQQNAAVQNQLNKDFSARGNLDFDMRENGGIFLGDDGAFSYWSYEEFIVNPATGTEELILPEKTVLIAAPQARFTKVYGAIEAMEDGKLVIEATPRFIQMFGENDPASMIIQVHSAPLMVMNHPNSVAVLTVLP